MRGAAMGRIYRIMTRGAYWAFLIDEMADETMRTCGEPGDIVAIIEGMLAERDALPPLSEPEPEPPWMWCPACLARVEGQLAHMEPGGCMAPGL